MKNKLLIPLICMMLLAMMATGVYASNNSLDPNCLLPSTTKSTQSYLAQIQDYSQEIKDLEQSEYSKQPVAMVFEKAITVTDIEIVLKSASIHGKQLTKEQILDHYVLYKAVAHEAKRLGVYPSVIETEQFVASIFAFINGNEKLHKEMTAELNGRDITEKDYIRSHFSDYRDLLAAYKLKDMIVEEKQLMKKDPYEANKIYSEYLSNLVLEAKIQKCEVLDQDYLKD